MPKNGKDGFTSSVKPFYDKSKLVAIFRLRKLNEMLSGGLAQLVEHLPCKQGVSGSIPLTSTKPLLKRTNGFIAQLVRAHA